MEETIDINFNQLDFLISKQDLILKLFQTSLKLGETNQLFNLNGKQRLIISGTKVNRDKTKNFISSLCNPEEKELIKINLSDANFLRSKNYINNLIENFQVYLQVLNDEILIQGKKEDIKCVKEILNVEKIRVNQPIKFFLDEQNDKNEIIFIKDNKNKVHDAKSNTSNLSLEKKKNNLIQFESKESSVKDKDCEIIKFIPSSKKLEQPIKTKHSANLNEYAELFNMDFDKNAEKQNKVKRIDKLISAMPDEQKILALNHVNNYQRKNSKRSEIGETDPIIFMSKKTVPNQIIEDILHNFELDNNSNTSQIAFQPSPTKSRARSRTERKIDQSIQPKNSIIDQNNKHGRSKSSFQSKSNPSGQLRHIIIDGSNVAREHGKQAGKFFSCKGIKLAVDYFLNRGHDKIYAVVPRFRRGTSDKECPTLDPEILDNLEEKGYLTYTPSRYVEKKLIVPYDDRFILDAALFYDGIIVSNDNYRDLMDEKPEYKKLVQNNLLQFSFIGDLFLVAVDPMGKNGPKLDEFLSKPIEKANNFKPVCSSSALINSKEKIINLEKIQPQSLKKKKNRDEERENMINLIKNIFPNNENDIRSLVYSYKQVKDVNFFVDKLVKRK